LLNGAELSTAVYRWEDESGRIHCAEIVPGAGVQMNGKWSGSVYADGMKLAEFLRFLQQDIELAASLCRRGRH
jgi:hypothetical protein